MDVQFGSVEAIGAAASYVDNAAAVMDYDAGGSFAQFGAKAGSLGNAGTKIRTVLAGVVKDAITIAASGLLITLLAGSTLAAQAVTATTLTIASGLTVSAGGITVGTVVGGAAVTTPTCIISLGSTYTNVQGQMSKAKVKVYEDNSGLVFGFGAYASALEYHTPSGVDHDWYVNNALIGRMTRGGIFAWGTTVTTGASAGDIVLANGSFLRGVVSGVVTSPIISIDANGFPQMGTTTMAGPGKLSRDTFLNLPSSGATRDGIAGMDSSNNRFVYYVNGNRYYLTGTSF
jgi:hypothetical protein